MAASVPIVDNDTGSSKAKERVVVTAIGGVPGHWRRTTWKHRAVLYGIVIVLVSLFTVFLIRVSSDLQEDYNMDSIHETWDSF